MKYPDLMLDIETYGQNSYATILAIAAVEFNLHTGEIGDTFYTTVNENSCYQYGLKSDQETIDWWDKQSIEARKYVFSGKQLGISTALSNLNEFILNRNPNFKVWGNGSSFDCVIVKNAFNKVGFNCPWKFYNERDVRTLVELNPSVKKNTIFNGIPHYAPDDCKHQIKYCHEIFKSINISKQYKDKQEPVRFFNLNKKINFNKDLIKF